MYRFLQRLCGLLRKVLFHMEKEYMPLPEGACLIIANHASVFDPVILMLAIRRKVCFVASSHLFRNPIIRVFLKSIGAIPCDKGGMRPEYLFSIRKALKDGAAVCIFAEGNITYDGVTAPVLPGMGRLIKLLKVPLVTVKIEGAYFIRPRWSSQLHSGKIQCEIAGRYSNEEIKEMAVKELNERLNRDLYTEAVQYAKQHDIQTKLHTEGIHLLLQICPVCGTFQGIRGHGNRIHCSCGATAKIDPYGELHGMQLPFRTLAEWTVWQKEELKRRWEEKLLPAVVATNVRLYRIAEQQDSILCDSGVLRLSQSCLTCGEKSFPLKNILHMDTRNKGILTFSVKGEGYFEVRAKKNYCGLLFKEFYQIVTKG